MAIAFGPGGSVELGTDGGAVKDDGALPLGDVDACGGVVSL